MEQWESLLEGYRNHPDIGTLSKVTQTAETVLKEDLASFEIDWIAQSLLYEPISLLDLIRLHRTDDAWSKPIGDGFKQISTLVGKYHVEKYLDDIVEHCQLPFDARTRAHALHCLSACARHTVSGIQVDQYIASLEEASSCKSPLAVLVGTICEFHPEVVAEDAAKIWRVYLNMLESNKNTDTVISAVLQGIASLFKNFGTELPMSELGLFYNKLSRDYMKSTRCETVVLSILQNYSVLFKERLAADASYRRHLWTIDNNVHIAHTLIAVYEKVLECVSGNELQNIISTEIEPQALSRRTKLKYTALRLLSHVQKLHNVRSSALDSVDVFSLEFLLRNEVDKVTDDVAEAVSWCIESQTAHSDKLLQMAILCHNSIPTAKRRDVIVKGILNAPAELMTATLNFLITESCAEESSLTTYIPVWREIFESDLIERKQILFAKFVEHVLQVLEVFLEDFTEEKKLPDKLSSLLSLASHVFSLQADDVTEHCAPLPPLLLSVAMQCGLEVSVVEVVGALIRSFKDNGDLMKIYKMMHIDRCRHEALLCRCCLAVADAPAAIMDTRTVLTALEIIFSRSDAEPQTLSSALQKLEFLITNEKESLGEKSLSSVIHLVEKLRSRTDMIGKEARILHRDVVIFLGKYSSNINFNDLNSDDNTMIVKLKDLLNLTIPNTIDGTTYKINLQRILQLAIIHEDGDSLHMLLAVICANSSTPTNAALQAAAARVLAAMCRAAARGGAPPPLPPSACVSPVHLLQYITTEKSPGVRRLLSDTLEQLLKESSSRSGDELARAVAEQASVMMSSYQSTTKLAGLDIAESLIVSLKDKNLLARNLLPDLLVLISKTNELDSHIAFEKASDLFIEKIELFSARVLNNTVDRLLELATCGYEIENDIDAKIYKRTVKMTVELLKKVRDQHSEGKGINVLEHFYKVYEKSESEFVKCVYVLAILKDVFDVYTADEVLQYKSYLIVDKLFDFGVDCGGESHFETEAVLTFLTVFAEALLKNQNQKTLIYLSNIIEKLSPTSVKYLQRNLTHCLTAFKRILDDTPQILLASFANWTEQLPIQHISECVEKEKYDKSHAVAVNALRIMLDIFDLKHPSVILTAVNVFVPKWVDVILKTYSSGQMKYLRNEMSYLTDLLAVSLKFLTVAKLKKILLEGHGIKGMVGERVGVEFCMVFMTVFARYLLAQPFLLLDADMSPCSAALRHVVAWCVRQRRPDDVCARLLQLVDQLWPRYSEKSTFKDKVSLLLDLSRLDVKLPSNSAPMLWAKGVLCSEKSLEEKSAVVGVLPGGEDYSACYIQYASLLPTRMSDCRGARSAALRTLIDALAATGDATLLNIVIKMAAGDEMQGWWDAAMDSCMASLALRAGDALPAVYRSLGLSPLSTSVCDRLFIPLLRYSSSSRCEQFFSATVTSLLTALATGQIPPTVHSSYARCVVNNTRVMNIIQVLLEKVPAASIESPSSLLYANLKTDKPWHFIRATCKLTVTLRDRKCPDGASAELIQYCRAFQQAAYKTLCACVCAWRPGAVVYGKLFDATVWGNIVDHAEEYHLPLRPQWSQRKIRKAVAIPVEQGGGSLSEFSSTRSRVFLTTLSENPLCFDLIADEQLENIQTQDLHLPDSALNQHPCAATLTALFQHEPAIGSAACRTALCEALCSAARNARWLLAQAICNCKEQLQPYASELRPALLAVVVDTAAPANGTRVLNGLHIDILNTLISWRDDIAPSPQLNTTTDYLISTCLVNRDKPYLYRMLLECINGFIDVYKDVRVSWSVFEPYLKVPSDAKSCIPILLRISKNKIHIPELIPLLLSKMSDGRHLDPSKMAELFGHALQTCDNEGRSNALEQFKRIVDKLRRSNISDYLKMLYYSKCCDHQQFKTVADQAQKVPLSERNKCLEIMSAYMSEHPGSPAIADISPELRALLDERSGDRAFEDFFKTPLQHQPPTPKRVKLPPSSRILDTVGDGEKHFARLLSRLGKDKDTRVEGKLCKHNMAVRFAECFYIHVYLPVSYPAKQPADVCECLSACLEMLFSRLRSEERFGKVKLREEPLEISGIDTGPPKLTTASRTYVGTLRTFAYGTGGSGSRRRQARPDVTVSEVDVQVTIDKILDTFIQFAKKSPDVSTSLLTQLLHSLTGTGTAGSGFDSLPVISRLLSNIVEKAASFVVMSKDVVDSSCGIDGFQQTVEQLKKRTVGTEAEQLIRLLHEEVRMRTSGPEQFELGSISTEAKDEDVMMSHGGDWFSITDLAQAFQKLSNWDELTFQEKRRIEAELPRIWTDNDTFKATLPCSECPSWFAKMCESYTGEHKQDSMRWLRELDKWPRRHFALSAVTEAIEWHRNYDDVQQLRLPCDMRRSDCLVEWAARLMIRSLHLSEKFEDGNAVGVLSRSHELQWCVSATERGLPQLALQCIQRNTNDLYENETLHWIEQKVLALKELGLKQADTGKLTRALDIADKYSPMFFEHSSPETIIGMKKLQLQLNYSLTTLSDANVQGLTQEVDAQLNRLAERSMTSNFKKTLSAFYETAMLHYDDTWDENKDHNTSLYQMCGILNRAADQKLFRIEGLAAIILNRLEDCASLNEETGTCLIETLQPLLERLPPFYSAQLQSRLALFPAGLRAGAAPPAPRGAAQRRCVELLCGADVAMINCCEMLAQAEARNDATKWREAFDKLKGKIFENPYAGADYQSLIKYRKILYEIQDYDSSTSSDKRDVLKDVINDFVLRAAQPTLTVAQLCPALTDIDDEASEGLSRLLNLRRGIKVVRIDDQQRPLISNTHSRYGRCLEEHFPRLLHDFFLSRQLYDIMFRALSRDKTEKKTEIQVYTDSVKRPAVLRVRLSDGTAARYLVKCEPLAAAAAASHAGACHPLCCDGPKVIQLSEDCGLIEFLEDHVRIRDLICSACDLKGIEIKRQATKNEELILTPLSASVHNYRQICQKIPARSLRFGVESHSSCVQDFIEKKRKFLQTLTSMTIVNWIFGLGDRHLQNILYSIRDGGVVCIDWGAVFHYGGAELPPARLTRNLVAVCDTTVLESQVQSTMKSVRDSYKLLLPIIRISFKCMGQEFQDKLPYITRILQGTALSYHITREVLQKSDKPYKEKYIQLLDNIFEKYEQKPIYTVEEQVSCLLQHSTDARILSVTRTEWEPWL